MIYVCCIKVLEGFTGSKGSVLVVVVVLGLSFRVKVLSA